jgi:hypothetical protein
MPTLKKIELSDDLQYWLHDFSQSAAVDMGEGGDDEVCVAEVCLTCIDSQDRAIGMNLGREVDSLITRHGYDAVLSEAAKHVCTL